MLLRAVTGRTVIAAARVCATLSWADILGFYRAEQIVAGGGAGVIIAGPGLVGPSRAAFAKRGIVL